MDRTSIYPVNRDCVLGMCNHDVEDGPECGPYLQLRAKIGHIPSEFVTHLQRVIRTQADEWSAT